jgi:hypothetical protein
MTRRKLPIGIQTFARIRDEGYYYVDKTPLIARLAEGGGAYFLSRPRRFGKTLLLDTLAEAFAGNRVLFEGGDAAVRLGADPKAAERSRLYLADHWDWEKRHPVIRISFVEGRCERRDELDRAIRRQLRMNAERLGVTLTEPEDIVGSFGELIDRAANRHNARAVVLVDEYDKPILDNLTEPDVARQMREALRSLYSVLKGRDADLRFVFLTGVSKFSKVSIFSGLNHLNDITLDAHYATICGYTEGDLDTVFAPEFETAAATDGKPLDRAEVRRWYNGYAWDGEPVYNPFDVLLLFDKREYRAWWFETGTPTFLIEWLKSRQFFTPQLEGLYADDQLLSAFDVDAIEPEAMLWQTGYLTVAERLATPQGGLYRLRVPNDEVRVALNRALLGAWLPQVPRPTPQMLALYQVLASGDAAALKGHFDRLFAAIPHDWYRANPIAQYEGYFASVCYSFLASLGVSIIPEDVMNQGQCDLTVRHGATVWVFEFKVVDNDATGEALRQLQARDYAAKYRGAPAVERVIEVGVEFSKQRRAIVGWEVAVMR